MMHILSLILLLLCQVHKLTAAEEEEEGGTYKNAKHGDDLAGDKICYNRKGWPNDQIYSFENTSSKTQ